MHRIIRPDNTMTWPPRHLTLCDQKVYAPLSHTLHSDMATHSRRRSSSDDSDDDGGVADYQPRKSAASITAPTRPALPAPPSPPQEGSPLMLMTHVTVRKKIIP